MSAAPTAGSPPGWRTEDRRSGWRRPSRWRPVRVVALAVGVGLALSGLGHTGSSTTAAHGTGRILGPGVVTVEVELRHSRFAPDDLRVRAGTVLILEVDNLDPIHHELVLGPPEVHDEHAAGSGHLHPPMPGEVSLSPLGRGTTFYEFEDPGVVAMACHLPGHVEHGMVGRIEVVA